MTFKFGGLFLFEIKSEEDEQYYANWLFFLGQMKFEVVWCNFYLNESLEYTELVQQKLSTNLGYSAHESLIIYWTRSVSHWGLAIYIKKYLKTKEELWKLKYFTMQKYNLTKNSLKETKILQDIVTL